MPVTSTKDILNQMAEARGEMEKIDAARIAMRKTIADLSAAYSEAATREAKEKAAALQKKGEEERAKINKAADKVKAAAAATEDKKKNKSSKGK